MSSCAGLDERWREGKGVGERRQEFLEERESDYTISWRRRTSARSKSNSAEIGGDTGVAWVAATVGADTSIILSAISTSLSRVLSTPRGARTIRTLFGRCWRKSSHKRESSPHQSWRMRRRSCNHLALSRLAGAGASVDWNPQCVGSELFSGQGSLSVGQVLGRRPL